MQPFLGQVGFFAGPYPPRGWAFASGQLLSITQNLALFSLLGTAFGGNGSTTFALPDLRGRAAVHPGSGSFINIGTQIGTTSVTLTRDQLPTHNHVAMASKANGTESAPNGKVLASALNVYRLPDTNMTPCHPDTVSTVGGSQPHENMAPYLVVSACIALSGIFPSQG